MKAVFALTGSAWTQDEKYVSTNTVRLKVLLHFLFRRKDLSLNKTNFDEISVKNKITRTSNLRLA